MRININKQKVLYRIEEGVKVPYNDHVEQDTGHYINVKKWLSRIYKVVSINDIKDNKGNDQEWILDSDCKLIFAYLFNFGKVHGYDNIYPNYELICNELGINDKKLSRKLSILSEIGMITIIKSKSLDGRFDSNRYKVNTPRSIINRKWYDVNKNQLVGKLYQFDYLSFKNGKFTL
jgi:hypothetical protein